MALVSSGEDILAASKRLVDVEVIVLSRLVLLALALPLLLEQVRLGLLALSAAGVELFGRRVRACLLPLLQLGTIVGEEFKVLLHFVLQVFNLVLNLTLAIQEALVILRGLLFLLVAFGGGLEIGVEDLVFLVVVAVAIIVIVIDVVKIVRMFRL